MSAEGRRPDKVDRKLQEVAVAEYIFRHEAEFAAGFLEDAGIPYRLQIDDAGGAGLGLSLMHPAILWVRAVDIDAARDLVALEEDDPEPDPVARPADVVRIRGIQDTGLGGLERIVSGGVGLVLISVAPNLPPMPLREVAMGACGFVGLFFLAVALVARAPGAVAELIRMISGSPPR